MAGDVRGVDLFDLLPPNVTDVETDFLCARLFIDQNSVSCENVTIPANSSRTFGITVTPTAPGIFVNNVRVEREGLGRTELTIASRVLAPTTLSITKEVSSWTGFVGDTLTYAIRVTNTGNAVAEEIVLTDSLPDSVVFLSANLPCSQSPANVLSCNLGSIPPGFTTTVLIQVRPSEAGQLVNTVIAGGTNTNLVSAMSQVAGSQFDPNLANNRAVASVSVFQCMPEIPLG